MARQRTHGHAFRRLIYLRVLLSALLLFVCVTTAIGGALAVAIISGLLAASYIALTAFWVRAYRRTDPARLAAPLDPNLRPTLRYPKPDKKVTRKTDRPAE